MQTIIFAIGALAAATILSGGVAVFTLYTLINWS
jgi:hypothetical protein